MDIKDIKDALETSLHYMPFIGLVLGDETKPKGPLLTRLLETVVMALVILWGSVQVYGNDINWIKNNMELMHEEMRIQRSQIIDLYRAKNDEK